MKIEGIVSMKGHGKSCKADETSFMKLLKQGADECVQGLRETGVSGVKWARRFSLDDIVKEATDKLSEPKSHW